MKDFNKVVLELADDMHQALMQHKPTPEIAFAGIGSLVLELTQNLCAHHRQVFARRGRPNYRQCKRVCKGKSDDRRMKPLTPTIGEA